MKIDNNTLKTENFPNALSEARQRFKEIIQDINKVIAEQYANIEEICDYIDQLELSDEDDEHEIKRE